MTVRRGTRTKCQCQTSRDNCAIIRRVTMPDPDLQELENLSFALKAIHRRRDETIRAIAARRRRGDYKTMSQITGKHPHTIAAIASGQPSRA